MSNFKLKIINNEKFFRVDVYDGTKIIHQCGWKGDEFHYKGKLYGIFGPYHSLEGGDKFKLYELVPVSEEA